MHLQALDQPLFVTGGLAWWQWVLAAAVVGGALFRIVLVLRHKRAPKKGNPRPDGKGRSRRRRA